MGTDDTERSNCVGIIKTNSKEESGNRRENKERAAGTLNTTGVEHLHMYVHMLAWSLTPRRAAGRWEELFLVQEVKVTFVFLLDSCVRKELFS